MKILFLISLTLLLTLSAFGQPDRYTTQEQLNNQMAGVMEGLIRTSERDLKAEAKKRDKSEMYRLRQLAQIQINAPADKVASLLFNALSNQYIIEQQAARQARFILSKKKNKKHFPAPPAFKTWLFKDSRVNVLARVSEGSSNTATISINLVPNILVFRAEYSDIKKIKKARTDIIDILAKVKSDAENN